MRIKTQNLPLTWRGCLQGCGPGLPPACAGLTQESPRQELMERRCSHSQPACAGALVLPLPRSLPPTLLTRASGTKDKATGSCLLKPVLVQAAGSRVPVFQAQVRTPEHGSNTRSEGHSLMLHAGLRRGSPLPRECPQRKGRGVSPTASPIPPCCVYYLRLLTPPFPPLLFLPLPSLFLSACS